jgi:hypothetical protein
MPTKFAHDFTVWLTKVTMPVGFVQLAIVERKYNVEALYESLWRLESAGLPPIAPLFLQSSAGLGPAWVTYQTIVGATGIVAIAQKDG